MGAKDSTFEVSSICFLYVLCTMDSAGYVRPASVRHGWSDNL